MAQGISFKWDESTEVTTGKNGYTEAQQRDYMTRTATDLVKENRQVQEEELYQDRNFIDSMSILHAKQEGADVETPDDKELVKWGLGYLADVNYNLMDLGEAAVDFNDATDMEKMAMAYGMETYDAKDVTWDGVGRFAQAFATDPTNLIGFGTLGAGFAAKFAGKGVAKQAFKKMLLNPANIAAMEGAAFVGAEDAMRQDLEVDVGMKDEYDPMQTLTASTIGAVGGKALGEGAAWIGKKLSKMPTDLKQNMEADTQAIQVELNDPKIKADFGAELMVGGIAGIEQDEEGNVSFDPVKFMVGFLGGHVAKKIATNPRLNAKAKKEAMAYAQRMHDKLEDTPYYQYITGIQKAVDDRGVKAIPEVSEAIDKTTRDANFKKWFEGSKVVDESGEPKVMYHQTTKEAADNIYETEFDITKGKARLGDNLMPDGFFFKPTESDIGVGGDNKVQMPVYLDIKKPFYIKDREDMEFVMSKEIPKFQKLLNKQKEIDKKFSKLLDEQEEILDAKPSEEYRSYIYEFDKKSKAILEQWENEQKDIPTESRKLITDFLKKEGYDGLIMKNDAGSFGRKVESYVVLEPNKIKSVNNKGAFSKDGNILKSAMIVPAIGAGAVATSQQSEEQ